MAKTLNQALTDLLRDDSKLLVYVIEQTRELSGFEAWASDAEVTATTEAELIAMIRGLIERSALGEFQADVNLHDLGIRRMRDYWERRLLEMIRSAQRGSGSATDELMRRLFHWLPRWVGRHRLKAHVAQDVYQDVAFTVFQEITKLDDPNKFDAWAYRIAQNRAKRAVAQEVIRPRRNRTPLDADGVLRPTVIDAIHDSALQKRLAGMMSSVQWAVSGAEDYDLALTIVASAVRHYLVMGVTDRLDYAGSSSGILELQGVEADDEPIAEGLTRYRWRLLSTKLPDQRNATAAAGGATASQ